MKKLRVFTEKELKHMETIEKDLRELSTKMIGLLKEYKEQGVIDEKQYLGFVKLKVDFLSNLGDE